MSIRTKEWDRYQGSAGIYGLPDSVICDQVNAILEHLEARESRAAQDPTYPPTPASPDELRGMQLGAKAERERIILFLSSPFYPGRFNEGWLREKLEPKP